MDDTAKVAVTLIIAFFLAIGTLALLLIFFMVSLPFYLIIGVFVALVTSFFVVIQGVYIAYAIAAQLLFPKPEEKSGRKRRAEYSLGQSKEAK